MTNEHDIKDWIQTRDSKFCYQLLDRMRQDCEYYIRNDFKTGNCLWAGDQKRQIEIMKFIWSSFSDNDKPEWLSWEEILEFEKKMC